MNRRVPWWQAFASVPLLVGLFVGEHQLRLSPTGHQTVQVIIVLFIFGLLYLWLAAQPGPLIQEEFLRHRMTFEERQSEESGRASEQVGKEGKSVLLAGSTAPAETVHRPTVAIDPVEHHSHHSLN